MNDYALSDYQFEGTSNRMEGADDNNVGIAHGQRK